MNSGPVSIKALTTPLKSAMPINAPRNEASALQTGLRRTSDTCSTTLTASPLDEPEVISDQIPQRDIVERDAIRPIERDQDIRTYLGRGRLDRREIREQGIREFEDIAARCPRYEVLHHVLSKSRLEDKGVVTRFAEKLVCASTTFDAINARATLENICARASGHRICARPT